MVNNDVYVPVHLTVMHKINAFVLLLYLLCFLLDLLKKKGKSGPVFRW